MFFQKSALGQTSEGGAQTERSMPSRDADLGDIFSNRYSNDSSLENESLPTRAKSLTINTNEPQLSTSQTIDQKAEPQRDLTAGKSGQPPPSFFFGNGGLGLNLTVGMGMLAAGYQFGVMNYSAVVAGGLLWFGIEKATAPFFETEQPNLLNVGHWLLDHGIQIVQKAGNLTIDMLAPKNLAPTIKNIAVGSEFFAARTALAATCFAAGWTQLFGALSIPLCGLSGAILYRAVKVATQSSDQKGKNVDEAKRVDSAKPAPDLHAKIGFLANLASWFSDGLAKNDKN